MHLTYCLLTHVCYYHSVMSRLASLLSLNLHFVYFSSFLKVVFIPVVHSFTRMCVCVCVHVCVHVCMHACVRYNFINPLWILHGLPSNVIQDTALTQIAISHSLPDIPPLYPVAMLVLCCPTTGNPMPVASKCLLSNFSLTSCISSDKIAISLFLFDNKLR